MKTNKVVVIVSPFYYISDKLSNVYNNADGDVHFVMTDADNTIISSLDRYNWIKASLHNYRPSLFTTKSHAGNKSIADDILLEVKRINHEEYNDELDISKDFSVYLFLESDINLGSLDEVHTINYSGEDGIADLAIDFKELVKVVSGPFADRCLSSLRRIVGGATVVNTSYSSVPFFTYKLSEDELSVNPIAESFRIVALKNNFNLSEIEEWNFNNLIEDGKNSIALTSEVTSAIFGAKVGKGFVESNSTLAAVINFVFQEYELTDDFLPFVMGEKPLIIDDESDFIFVSEHDLFELGEFGAWIKVALDNPSNRDNK